MKILITGPKGYLAQNLMKNKGGFEYVYETNEYGEIVETDVCWPDRFESYDFDLMIHNAAIVGTTNCLKSSYTLDVNMNGTMNMIKLCLKKDKPMIFLSTTVVYDPTDELIVENSVKKPQTLYGMTKYLGEVAVRNLMQKFIIIRPCMIYGPGDKHSAMTMMANCKKGKQTIYLDPKYMKPYLHVDHFVRGMNHIIENHDKLLGNDFNFAPSMFDKFEKIVSYMHGLLGISSKDYELVKDHDYLGNHVLSGDKIRNMAGVKIDDLLYSDLTRTYAK